jgi:glycosyltransferase involved in cell wall biosynthesis
LATEGNNLVENNKILFLTHNYIRHREDYAGVFLHLLATKLRDIGFEIHVVAPHDPGCAEFEEIDGIKIHRFRYADDMSETFAYRGDMHRQIFRNPFKLNIFRDFLNSAFKLAADIIDKENISIVSTHWVIPNGIVARRLKNKFGNRIRLFLHSHGTDIRLLTRSYFIYSFFKSLTRMAERWTVVSNYLLRLVLERDLTMADKIEVVPMPNNEKIFYPDPNVTEDPNLIIAVSRLTVQKRLGHLIEAVNALREDFPHLKLEIYGSGPEKQKLLSIIESRNLQDKIRIIEPIPQKDLRKVYNTAAVVVLNSIDEGFGLSLTEAMLCKRPVIGTESGGITDIIDDGKTGLLVSPDNIGELAEALRRLMIHPEDRDRLAEAGYKKAVEQFTSTASARRFAEIYREPAQ